MSKDVIWEGGRSNPATHPDRPKVADWLDRNGVNPNLVSADHGIWIEGKSVVYCRYLRNDGKLVTDLETNLPMVERISTPVTVEWKETE